jgi:hypothetical protein
MMMQTMTKPNLTFELNKENYFSLEANQHYMSVSQFKDFAPAFGGCEARALAKVKGEYIPKEIKAFVEGHYVHSWNEGTLDKFKEDNPDIYSSRGPTSGQLKSEFQRCNKMIEILEGDPLVMKALQGQKEVLFTAELFGIQWKVMIDSYNPDMGIFTDLKTLKDMDSRYWNKDSQCFENFLEHYGYILQLSVYAEVERIASKKDEWLLPHMVVITKQDPPDHDIIYFDHEAIQQQLNIVGNHIERVKVVKSGEVDPVKCGSCDYCRLTKKVKRPKHYAEFNLY